MYYKLEKSNTKPYIRYMYIGDTAVSSANSLDLVIKDSGNEDINFDRLLKLNPLIVKGLPGEVNGVSVFDIENGKLVDRASSEINNAKIEYQKKLQEAFKDKIRGSFKQLFDKANWQLINHNNGIKISRDKSAIITEIKTLSGVINNAPLDDTTHDKYWDNNVKPFIGL